MEATYKKSILPNGLRIVSEEISHVRSASVGVWIDVGSRDEHSENNGLSHFVEHMVFKGTKNRNVREIAQSIESVGGYLNAFTSKENTCYYARVLDEYTELAVDVLADMVLSPLFPAKELEKEKGVVIEELKNAEDDPDDIIHDYLEKAIYGKNSLGFPVIGAEASLRSFKRSDLTQHRSQSYTPSRIVIAAAGNLKHEKFVRLVEKYFRFDAQKPAPRGRLRPSPVAGKYKEFEKPIQQAHACIGTIAYSIKDELRYPLMVLNTLLGDGMSSRLFQNIRERYGFAYSVYSFSNMLSDTGSFGAYVGTDKQHVKTSLELIWKELDTLKRKPVPAADLKRTKDQLKGSMMLSLESISNRMMRLGSSEVYFGELHSLDEVVAQINAVTPDEIQSVARDLFKEDAFSSIVFLPDGRQASAAQGMAAAAMMEN